MRGLGTPVVDADQVARDVVLPGTEGLSEVVATFGQDVLSADGTLDRKRLGALVFADPAARARLNGLLHPRIAIETARRMEALRHSGVPFALYEAALLVENGAHHAFDGLIVVEAEPAGQRARVMARDEVTAEEADRRLAAQLSNAERRRAADVVLENNGSEEALAEAVRTLHQTLSRDELRRLQQR
jgi:dephospho-CoA kinase